MIELLASDDRVGARATRKGRVAPLLGSPCEPDRAMIRVRFATPSSPPAESLLHRNPHPLLEPKRFDDCLMIGPNCLLSGQELT
ncbi:MAG: hypothetical protein AB7U35_06235 [Sphingobium sp.]